MSLDEKYNLNLDGVKLVKSLPEQPKQYLYFLPDNDKDEYTNYKLYINENGKLKLIVYKVDNFYILSKTK